MFTRKNKIKVVSALLAAVVFLSGCSLGTPEEDDNIVIKQDEEKNENALVAVTVEDVIVSRTVRCTYRQVDDEALSFSYDGKIIDKVYVEEGDEVTEGQLLAQVVAGTLTTDIETLEYRIARNELLYEQALENQDIEIRILNQRYEGRNPSENDWKVWQDTAAAIRQRYRYVMEDYLDSIKTDTMRLEALREEQRDGLLYAGMSGTVSFLKKRLEGSISTKDEVIIRIIDSKDCIFVSKQTEYMDYIKDGMTFKIDVMDGTAMGKYEVRVHQRDTWGDEMYFILTEDYGNIDLHVGATGEIKVVLEEKKQVLAVPADSVHTADGRSFVYVLGDNQIREVKWITTGVWGDSYVEVTEGLSEGDKVILK